MTNREKVISGLIHHRKKCSINGDICPYHEGRVLIDQDECVEKLCDDVLELLEAQEPVRPVKQIEQTEWTVCGNCRNHLISKWIFCPYCGREVKRDVIDNVPTIRNRRNPSLDVNPPRIVPKYDKKKRKGE